jgi:hypothetical protein
VKKRRRNRLDFRFLSLLPFSFSLLIPATKREMAPNPRFLVIPASLLVIPATER